MVVTKEAAETILQMSKEGYSCSAIARVAFDEFPELGIRERDVNYETGYRLLREATIATEYVKEESL